MKVSPVVLQFLSLVLLLSTTVSCSDQAKRRVRRGCDKLWGQFGGTLKPYYSRYSEFDLYDLSLLLQSEPIEDHDKLRGEWLHRYYADNKFEPLWYSYILDDSNHIDSLLTILGHSEQHGVACSLFLIDSLAVWLAQLRQEPPRLELEDYYQLMMRFDYTLSKAYINYAAGMQYGFVDPHQAYDSGYYIPVKRADSLFYSQLMSRLSDLDNLPSYTPTSYKYQTILDTYQSYLTHPDSLRSKRYRSLKATLERLRWQPDSLKGDKYVEVNIASAELFAYERGRPTLQMKVCVGKPPLHQTPLLTSRIFLMNLNPYWNIPRSIVKAETFPSILKEPDYLRKQNIELLELKTGKVADPDLIDFKSFTSKTVVRQYRFRQDSGDYNALGRIKFLFNNPFDVYLHDTPSKYAFDYRNRAVSHGCVRVQEPLQLMVYLIDTLERTPLLIDRMRYTIQRPIISKEGKEAFKKKKSLDKVRHNQRVRPSVPIFIDYYTAYFDGSGNLRYAPDLYQYDEILLQAMDSLRP